MIQIHPFECELCSQLIEFCINLPFPFSHKKLEQLLITRKCDIVSIQVQHVIKRVEFDKRNAALLTVKWEPRKIECTVKPGTIGLYDKSNMRYLLILKSATVYDRVLASVKVDGPVELLWIDGAVALCDLLDRHHGGHVQGHGQDVVRVLEHYFWHP